MSYHALCHNTRGNHVPGHHLMWALDILYILDHILSTHSGSKYPYKPNMTNGVKATQLTANYFCCLHTESHQSLSDTDMQNVIFPHVICALLNCLTPLCTSRQICNREAKEHSVPLVFHHSVLWTVWHCWHQKIGNELWTAGRTLKKWMAWW